LGIRIYVFGVRVALVLVPVGIVIVLVGIVFSRALDDFIEFSAIEPDTAAFRAIIYFHAVAVGEDEGFGTNGTLHSQCGRLMLRYAPGGFGDRQERKIEQIFQSEVEKKMGDRFIHDLRLKHSV